MFVSTELSLFHFCLTVGGICVCSGGRGVNYNTVLYSQRLVYPFGEHLSRPPVLREMPRRARLKLTNEDLSLQSYLRTSNSQVPPSRYQDGGSQGREQSGSLAIHLKLRKQDVAWQRSHLPATEIFQTHQKKKKKKILTHITEQCLSVLMCK